jgi:iron-sulfur cluster repair protein YtfE (RIC family)
MDLLEHLTQEHREVETLIAQLEESDPGERRNQLIDELSTALHKHMEVEEQFLYPIVAEEIGEEDTEEANNEHDLAREGIEKLYELRDEPGFAAALDMVKAGIEHHVEDEENEMFPELRQKAGDRIAGLEPEKLEQVIDLTKDQLYREAKEAGIEGRSDMTRDELARAIAEQT